jgi:pilus assembly protein CpaF
MSFEVIIPFLKPIRHLLEAETISEIMVNPDSSVWIEENGQIQSLPDIRFDNGALADAIPDHDRILLIEDTAELHIRKPHIISTESQVDTHRSKVTFDDLLKAVLRHRPDRIIVGEVRGPEARTLLDAMNTGHRGTLATIHASSSDESVRRLASLAIRSGSNLQLSVAEEDVLRCLDLVVYISRDQGGRRVENVIRIKKSA